MRRIFWLSGAAATAMGLAVASGATAAPETQEPLCRRAPKLAQLPPEMAQLQQQQQRMEYETERGEESADSSVVMAPPPLAPPPPPPPPPAAERGGDSGEKIAVTGSRVARPTLDSPSPVTTMPAPPAESTKSASRRPDYDRPPISPPAGLLTAGDYDDLLNPMLYARYVARAGRDLGQQVVGLPRVDTRRTLTINVEDSAGRPAPFVPVKITCADGNSLTLSTLADGRAVFFPGLDRLGKRITVTAAGAQRTLDIPADSGGQQQTLVARTNAAPVRKFDLMIALDSTGSMGDEIEFLKSELRSIVGDISAFYPQLDIRVGLVAYRDIGDEYVTRTNRLTGDLDVIQASLNRTRGTGGGDMPEAMDQALIRAVAQDWRPDAVKSMLLVADAPPHDELQGRAFAAAEAARARRIQIVPVASSGVDKRAEYFMRAVAAATQSRYVFLTDDSGIGNPHAEPDVDCYVVTQLATAIRRVLASQIGGQRIEPHPGEVIRTLGRYDHGKCVLPRNFTIQ
jgi:hypothetical protein